MIRRLYARSERQIALSVLLCVVGSGADFLLFFVLTRARKERPNRQVDDNIETKIVALERRMNNLTAAGFMDSHLKPKLSLISTE